MVVLITDGTNDEWGSYQRKTTYASRGYYEFSTLRKETDERLYMQSLVEQPEPNNGAILYSNGSTSGGEWPLTIHPDDTDSASYYFKVKDQATDELVTTFYLAHGSNVTVNLPVGNYTLTYASGDTWYGEENLFGPDTVYWKFKDVFEIEANYELTVELEKQVGGNLTSSQLDTSSF